MHFLCQHSPDRKRPPDRKQMGAIQEAGMSAPVEGRNAVKQTGPGGQINRLKWIKDRFSLLMNCGKSCGIVACYNDSIWSNLG